jgi:pimeloyl-ACP methyl ester carboxylesterase
MPYTSHYLTCAGREIHFTEWGAGSAGTVIAWHGLARTGRDMDELAEHLSQRGWRVICPDTLGRGLSQWSPDPKHEYCLAFYARLARELLDQLGIASTHWVGTSMGGAIGMVCASGYFEPSLKGRITQPGAERQRAATGAARHAAHQGLRGQPAGICHGAGAGSLLPPGVPPYGWLSDAQWRRLTETSTRRLPDGRVTPHYDPAMVRQFTDHPDDYRIWDHYDALEIPVLCLVVQAGM